MSLHLSASAEEGTVVTGRLPLGREVTPEDFTDLTSVPVVGVPWFDDGGLLAVRFDGTLADDEIAAVRRRITSASSAEEQARAVLAAPMPAVPTLDDLAARLAALTRVVNGDLD